MLINYRNRLGLTLVELVVVLAVLVAVAGLVIPRLTSVTEESKRQATLVTMGRLRDVLMGTPGMPGYFQDMELSPIGGFYPTGSSFNQDVYLEDLYWNPAAIGGTSAPNNLYTSTFDPTIKLGWRGPYLTNSAGTLSSALAQYPTSRGRIWPSPPSDSPPAVLDGWGNPIIIQWPQGNGITSAQTAAYVRLVSAGRNGVFDSPLTVADLTTMWLNASSTGYDDVVLYLRQPLSFTPPIQSQ
jgi:hypothetical protein